MIQAKVLAVSVSHNVKIKGLENGKSACSNTEVAALSFGQAPVHENNDRLNDRNVHLPQ